MKITVLDGYTLNPGDNPWDSVAAHGDFTVYERTALDEIIPRGADADVLLTNKTVLQEEQLNQLPNLKFIGVLATGYDTVDVSRAGELGIPVSNVPGYGTDAVAEHTFALLMELCRRTSLHDSLIREGKWAANPDWCLWETTQHGLAGKTMGVIGFGNTGRRVAEIAHAFGMNIVAHAPRPKPAPALERFAFTSLQELATQADVISLHCPLTADNKELINADFIASMKNGAMLLNTARGPLIDEEAAAAALHSGKLGGLGIDVAAVEPMQTDNPLLAAPNTLITPHIAWAALSARETLMRITADNIAAFKANSPINLVNEQFLKK